MIYLTMILKVKLVLLFLTLGTGEDAIKNVSNIFVATNEWQEVKEGQTLPQGLHIRINLSTGLKEAKLLNESENKANALSIVKESRDESEINFDDLKAKLQNIKDEKPIENEESIKQKFRSMEELKKLMKQDNVEVKTEAEIIRKLLQDYRNLNFIPEYNIDAALSILQDLEYLVHKFDNGLEFIKQQGIQIVIIPNLDNNTEKLRIQTLELLGACMQNNKKVQQIIFEHNVGEKLLNILETGSNKIKSKAIFTLGCLVRDFPQAQQKCLFELGGPTIRKVLNDFEHPDIKVKLRVITLLEDIVTENSTLINIHKFMHNIDFCLNIENLIITSKNLHLGDHDIIEKLLKALLTTLKFCQNELTQSNAFKNTMFELSNFYSKLIKEEHSVAPQIDNYFTEILNLINTLIKNLKIYQKQEL